MGTKRRSFLPFLSFPSFLSFQSFLPFLPLETFLSFFSFLPFLPLETFLSFFSFLPLETFQSFLTFLSFHTGKTFLSFLSFQACLALSVTALKRRATSPARGRGSPLRHSPLARPVPPLPHAGEANVTYRSCLPRLRDCEAEARPADETAEAEQGQRSVFCKPAATGAAKTGHRNRGPQGRRGPTFTGLRSKNRAPQPWPAGPERALACGHPSAAPERE